LHPNFALPFIHTSDDLAGLAHQPGVPQDRHEDSWKTARMLTSATRYARGFCIFKVVQDEGVKSAAKEAKIQVQRSHRA
jgi:hypothetical protein